ncbi:MAG TPA: serine protease [Burkholderiales bacterium]|jgi:hypothetical protein|nr:serine protease [Burkholderiales bacterium]
MKMHLHGLIAMFLGLSAASVDASELVPPGIAESSAAVFKLSARNQTGRVKFGSAVLVAPGRLLTTCHVARDAESIQVHRGATTLTAIPAFMDIEHDLCVLSAPELMEQTPVEVATAGELRVGDEVFAVGYPKGGRLAISKGKLKALHRHGAVRVLQVSAPFGYGQSGGALFDITGRLVGITAFKTLSGGDFHFALAFDDFIDDGIDRQAAVPASPGHKMAFWERGPHAQPLFLRAASLEADGEWKALLEVAQQWTASDSTNSASWLALWRALSSLKRDRDADLALLRAEALNQR